MGRLTDKGIQAMQPGEKAVVVGDGDGLSLVVQPNGTKLWWLRYRFGGKQKTLSIGVYPMVSLREARERAFEARKVLANGADPMAEKKAAKAAAIASQMAEHNGPQGETFEAVAREWFEKFSQNWAATHADKIIRRLERDVFPWMGNKPIQTISSPDLLQIIRRIEAKGALETAHRALAECGRVFRYAVATGRAQRDPSADLRGALPPRRRDKHFAAVTDPKIVGQLLRDIDGYQGDFTTKCAFKLSPLLMVRPGELRKMEWAEVDLENAQWLIPAEKMKARQPHIVPLAHQALEVLREIQPLTGKDRYVFPGARDKDRPISDNAVRSALRRMGWGNDEMTPHGFRAMASTILDNMGYRQEWIERQLAHEEQNKVKAAYKRDLYMMYLPERRKMMQEWADYLDGLRNGADVIPLRRLS